MFEIRCVRKYAKWNNHTVTLPCISFTTHHTAWKKWNRSAIPKVHSICLDTWKGITFGRRGNKLDLYYPPNTARSKEELAPLVVFIYGGAWASGERAIYCLLAKQMAEELSATVICPDYCTYPKVKANGVLIKDLSHILYVEHQWAECEVHLITVWAVGKNLPAGTQMSR